MRSSVFAGVAVLAAVVLLGNASADSKPSAASVQAGAAPAVHVRGLSGDVLFDNDANDHGNGISSQNFGSGYESYDSVAADDFSVPPQTTWRIGEVDVTGKSAAAPNSVNVTFYTNHAGLPGIVKKSFTAVPVVDDGGSFVLMPRKPVRLNGGTRGATYWLSVQTNQNLGTEGQWFWETSANAVGHANAWINPGGGFGVGCTLWTHAAACVPDAGPSQMFTLRGTAS